MHVCHSLASRKRCYCCSQHLEAERRNTGQLQNARSTIFAPSCSPRTPKADRSLPTASNMSHHHLPATPPTQPAIMQRHLGQRLFANPKADFTCLRLGISIARHCNPQGRLLDTTICSYYNHRSGYFSHRDDPSHHGPFHSLAKSASDDYTVVLADAWPATSGHSQLSSARLFPTGFESEPCLGTLEATNGLCALLVDIPN